MYPSAFVGPRLGRIVVIFKRFRDKKLRNENERSGYEKAEFDIVPSEACSNRLVGRCQVYANANRTEAKRHRSKR